MKNLLFLFLTLSTITAFSQQSVTVTINNVTNDDGKVVFGLYDENTFMKAAPVKSAEVTVEKGKVQAVFDSVAPGNYAILCYHDVNENGKMDFQSNGMPLENFGASNNDMSMGPPTWEASKFEVKEEPVLLDIRF
ncbi:MAG: DUF2141 domain-containing protein [Leeuwenhoekiella sp.]